MPSPNLDSVIDSILFLLASHFGGKEIEDNLVESHNLHLGAGGLREMSRFYELSDHTRSFLAQHMSRQVRLGFTQLDDLSLVRDEVIRKLLLLGFDVEVFSL